jgi:hypothetical protein
MLLAFAAIQIAIGLPWGSGRLAIVGYKNRKIDFFLRPFNKKITNYLHLKV